MNLEEFRILVDESNDDVEFDFDLSQVETFNLISKLFNVDKVIHQASHDMIFLNIEEDQIETLSLKDAKLLVRGGVAYDPDYEFYMYI